MYKQEDLEQSCRVYLEGDLTIYNVTELKAHFIAVLDDAKALEIDLALVTEIDSSGVQLLIWIKKERDRLNNSLKLVNMSPEVLHVFELLKLVSFFHSSPRLEDQAEVSDG